ncbi:hypothetical protein BV25DRAFT_1803980 [Artomyces pyxidatus]|uniref:Uncharacterized protein n=1 Tax=Artomyces pyxidatus TaxID=48021 RepID=A0ACB8T2R3_9AGAM|nr:hypothetical protein BV25DRAFT_1803980 [Artomyces pyxidatus]
MALFLDLPIELLPLILQHVVKASHLARIALVNRSFYTFAVPLLYERITIYPWYRHSKTRVVQLFTTLAEHPDLALFVRRLDIRDFPKALPSFDAHEQLRDSCVRGIENASHLRTCTWTRDGSLTSYIIEPLQKCTELSELEINGNHSGHYDPASLTKFTSLNKISLIMPSGSVLETLPRWIEATGHSLRTLTLICKASLLVTDHLLETISPHLHGLQHLHLAGCPRVTDKGIWAMIRHNARGLFSLGLEGLSPVFDMAAFSEGCGRAGGLTSLTSFTLTIHPDHRADVWMSSAVVLLSQSPLEIFQVYATSASYHRLLADRFCMRIVSMHGHRLKRFSFHRLRISLDALEHMCQTCLRLQELFVLVSPADLNQLGTLLAHAPILRTVHINLTARPTAFNPEQEALSLVCQCAPTVIQLGIETRVWEVAREVISDEDKITTRPVLSAYESPDVPEQFLVVRA